MRSPPRSRGTGAFSPAQFARFGAETVLEASVLVFHPENVEIGERVYVGHQTILEAYHRNRMVIGDGTWIGAQCFLHSAGGIAVGKDVGIGPGVKVLTSSHRLDRPDAPILHAELVFAAVAIEDDCDVGAGAVILPGVRVGRGAQVGAGAVVTRDVEPYSIVGGVPARPLGSRRPSDP